MRLRSIVENERAEHGVHDHVVTQISKFNTAFKKPETKRKIAEAVYNEILSDSLKEYFAKTKVKGELYKFLIDLFSQKPVVVIIIDELLDELREAVDELPLESKIVEFKTFVREDAPSIHAHLFKPLYVIEKEVTKKEGRNGEPPRAPPEHYRNWETMLAWVDDNTKLVTRLLMARILGLEQAHGVAHATYYCFYRGKPSTISLFAAFMLNKKELKVRIRTDAEVKDPKKWTGDKVYAGWFFKRGKEREFRITDKEQMDYAMGLIEQSYEISSENALIWEDKAQKEQK